MTRPRFAQRLYRALLKLFPAEFRGDFGTEMTQAFEDETATSPARLGCGAG